MTWGLKSRTFQTSILGLNEDIFGFFEFKIDLNKFLENCQNKARKGIDQLAYLISTTDDTLSPIHSLNDDIRDIACAGKLTK